MKIGELADTYDLCETPPVGYVVLPDDQATYLDRTTYPDLSAVLSEPIYGEGADWVLGQEINNPSPVVSDEFGYSVSITSTGDRVIIGARYEDTGASNTGSVYIYSRSGTTWTLEQEINNPSPVATDFFGYSVSISSTGDRGIIGARYEDTGADAAGSVYIYSRSGTTWTLEQEINNPSPVSGDNFGILVSMDATGDRVIIGAHNEDTGATDTGSAYIYSRSGTTWTLEQEINNPSPVSGDYFGYSVSINATGDRVIIGAYFEDTGATNAGSAYIYSRSDTTWTLEQEINNPSPVDYDNFGFSVAIDSTGDRVIIGAYYESTGATGAGSAYIYSRSGTVWTLEQEINNPSPVSNDYFGWSVAINSTGDRVIISASYEDTGASAAGSAYIYSRSGTTWTLEREINNPSPVASDQFGFSVSINSTGDRVIIGAHLEDTGALHTGAVYIYDLVNTTDLKVQALTNKHTLRTA
jgi:uncharacterized protein (DUF1800 family)